MIPSSIYHVDKNVTSLNIIETGRSTAPFHSVQQAINDGYSRGFFNIEIQVVAGLYPDPITILPNMSVVVKGGLSLICMLGDVTFQASGKFNPIVGTGTSCSFNDVVLQSVTINDNDVNVPAEHNVFITQNTSVIGNFIQTGKSTMTIFCAGIGSANAVISGFIQSSQVWGQMLVPGADISATNTSFSNSIISNQFYASGCDVADMVTGAVGIELHQCIVDGSLICDKIYLDDVSLNQVISKNLFLSTNPIILANHNVDMLTEITEDYQLRVSDQFIVISDNLDPITLTLPEHPFLGLQIDLVIYNSSNSIFVKDDIKKINGQNSIEIVNVYGHKKLTYIGKDRWLIK